MRVIQSGPSRLRFVMVTNCTTALRIPHSSLGLAKPIVPTAGSVLTSVDFVRVFRSWFTLMIHAVKWAVPYWSGPTGSGTFQDLVGFLLHRLAVIPRLQACVTPASGSVRFMLTLAFEVQGFEVRVVSNPDVYGER